jgi:hypothetical protein
MVDILQLKWRISSILYRDRTVHEVGTTAMPVFRQRDNRHSCLPWQTAIQAAPEQVAASSAPAISNDLRQPRKNPKNLRHPPVTKSGKRGSSQ